MSLARGLSGSERGAFRRDGYLSPLSILTEEEANRVLALITNHEAHRAGRLPPGFNMKIHLLLPRLWALVHDDRIVDAVEDVLGPELLCFGTSLISKSGTDQKYVSWHQDATHWGLSSSNAVTVWLALTPSTGSNGCVRVIPGTHLAPVAHDNMTDPDNMLGRKEFVTSQVDESLAIDLTLCPGEASMHHALVVHGSSVNTSGTRRLGFAIRYIPSSTRQVSGLRNFATLVRGPDRGHFEAEVAPESDFDPRAIRRHARVLRQGRDVIYGKAS